MLRLSLLVLALAATAWCNLEGKHHNKPHNQVTDDEIVQLSEKLFSLDNNKLTKLVKIDLQAKTFSSAKDESPRPLLQVNDDATKSANTNVKLLAKLYDNYVPDCTVPEVVTKEEVAEENALLDGLMSTPVLTSTLEFLAKKGLVPSGKAAQKTFLHKLWFTLYARGGRSLGSSAFEHVFLGEIKKGDVSGMHSWLYYNHEEEAGNANYYGYIKKLALGESGTLLKIAFNWNGNSKPANSLFIGASPELEMSLYTLCFLTRPGEKCRVSAHGTSFRIQTWSIDAKGISTIGSAYPLV